MRETHEHYDAEGNHTGTTFVTRASEWDDDQREHVLEWRRYQALTRRCGHHPSTGTNKALARVVDHGKHECFDCDMLDEARAKFHRTHAQNDDKGKCDICAGEDFWISQHLVLDEVSPRAGH